MRRDRRQDAPDFSCGAQVAAREAQGIDAARVYAASLRYQTLSRLRERWPGDREAVQGR